MFAVFTWTTTAARQKKKHVSENLERASLGTCIKSKNKRILMQYLPNQLVKVLRTVSQYLVPQHVKVSMSFLTCAAPRSSLKNVQELI